MASYKTEGVILKRINFGEADKILTIFTKRYGKIRAVAKGVRRVTSRKGGNLELFNWVVLFLATGRNLDLITEVQVKNPFAGFRKDLKKVGVAYYLCELVDKLCPDRQKNEEVLSLLIKGLDALQREGVDSEEEEEFIQTFERQILEILGFWPRGEKGKRINTQAFIEGIIEKRLKSPDFLTKVNQEDRMIKK